MLTVGDPHAFTVGRPRHEVERALIATTSDGLSASVESVFPSAERRAALAGVVTPDGFRLRSHDRDRLPWWLLEPVYEGHFATTGTDECEVYGRLVVRRTTLVVVVLLAACLWKLAGVWLACVVLAILVAEIAVVLPATAKRLAKRVASASQPDV